MLELFHSQMILDVIRYVATFVGVVIGWFITAPLAAIAYRIVARTGMPGWGMAFTRMIGGAAAGVAVYYFLPLGWGGGGFGPGGGPGNGGMVAAKDAKAGDVHAKPGTPSDYQPANKNVLPIELLGGKRYKNDMKYYLIDGQVNAVKLGQVEDFLKNNKKYTSVDIIITLQSVDEDHDAVVRLRNLTDKYKLPTQLVKPK